MSISTFFGIIASGAIDPIFFSDDYTTNTGWTQNGTKVTVNSAVAGKAAGTGNSTGNESVVKTMDGTLSDTLWFAEFDLKMVSASNWFSAPYVFTAGTGAATTATQDALGIAFNGTGASDATVFVFEKVAGAAATLTTTTDLNLVATTQYFARLERTTSTNLRVSIFSDSARTTHITNSPKNITIDALIGGLTHLQHTTLPDAADNLSTWEIDNTEVFDNDTP